jgi:hypothetical protein
MSNSWIWRMTSFGTAVATCAHCGTSIRGTDDQIRHQQSTHDDTACALAARTSATPQLRGTHR